MGIDRPLSYELIQQIIRKEEIPLRNEQVEPENVQSIFRYGAIVGNVIERFDRLGRGMDWARGIIKEHEENGASFPSGAVVLASELTAGKGRFQRYWHAPPGGLWMTLVIANTLLPETTHLYPLAAGISCCELLQNYGLDAHIKWVNDVNVQGKKIVGILAETLISPVFKEEYILIGVGINVNNSSFPPDLAATATSMISLSGKETDLEIFAARLLAKFAWNIGLLHFEEHCRLEAEGAEFHDHQKNHLLLDQWRNLTDCFGRRVMFGFNVQERQEFEAEVLGLDDSGGLILQRCEDGLQVIEQSGEILYLD